MNKLITTLLFVLASLAPAQTVAPSPAQLSGLTPRQALAKANQWRNTGGLQSFVTTEAVVFKFPSGEQKSVALPAKVLSS